MKISFLDLLTGLLCNMDNKMDGKWEIYIYPNSVGTFKKVIMGRI